MDRTRGGIVALSTRKSGTRPAALCEHGRVRGRRAANITGSLVIVVAVVAAVWGAGAWVVGRLDQSGPPAVCRALAANVDNLHGFAWDNGYTASGSEWGSVLTDGVESAERSERPSIATAVRADTEGYERLLHEVPTHLRSAVARLHTLVVYPERAYEHRADASVRADSLALSRFSVERCNLI